MDSPWMRRRLASVDDYYNQVARQYSWLSHFGLQCKPLDCKLLDLFADRVEGVIGDVGCGPGQVARYLKDRGARVIGVDMSAAMLAQARGLSPDIEFLQANMHALPVEADNWGGVAAFYSIIHTPRQAVAALFREFNRVIRPSGWVLIAFHVGRGTVRRHQACVAGLALDTSLFRCEEINDYLLSAGFRVESWLERPPYGVPINLEGETRRGYVLAQKWGSREH